MEGSFLLRRVRDIRRREEGLHLCIIDSRDFHGVCGFVVAWCQGGGGWRRVCETFLGLLEMFAFGAEVDDCTELVGLQEEVAVRGGCVVCGGREGGCEYISIRYFGERATKSGLEKGELDFKKEIWIGLGIAIVF